MEDVKDAADVRMRERNYMKIRKLDSKEHKDTRRLYEEVFPEDSKAFVDYYYAEKTKDNQIYVVEEEGAVQAMLHLNPYTLMVNGEEKDANYIVAVATRKEYRKRGYMAALMKTALRSMYEEGQAFTFLMPAAEEIYLPHDFRTVYRQKQRICRDAESFGGVPAGEEDADELAGTAERFLSQHYQVYVKRTKEYFVRLIKELECDGGRLLLHRQRGEIMGCRLYDAEHGEEQESPSIMARIVDVRRMLMSVRLKTLMAACFTVTDSIIAENNRCLTITGTEFSGVMLMEGKEENSEGTVTIAALSAFLFGAESVEELCDEEGVKLSGRLKAELKKIIPLSKIYLNEVV